MNKMESNLDQKNQRDSIRNGKILLKSSTKAYYRGKRNTIVKSVSEAVTDTIIENKTQETETKNRNIYCSIRLKRI